MQIALSFANGFPRCRGTDTHTHENVPRRPRRNNDNDNNDKEYKKKQTNRTNKKTGQPLDLKTPEKHLDSRCGRRRRRGRTWWWRCRRERRAAAASGGASVAGGGWRATDGGESDKARLFPPLPLPPPVNPRLFLFSKLALPSGHSGNHSRVEPFPVNIFNPFLENVCRFRENFSKNSDIQEKKTTCSISSWGGYWMLLTTSSGV